MWSVCGGRGVEKVKKGRVKEKDTRIFAGLEI